MKILTSNGCVKLYTFEEIEVDERHQRDLRRWNRRREMIPNPKL